MAYKDEYEVARLHSNYLKGALAEEFDEFPKLSFYFAPALLSRKNKEGKIKKKKFGPWFFPILKVLAKGKFIRGTIFDVFAYSSERKSEVRLIAQYESDVEKLLTSYKPEIHELCEEIALIPLNIKGFGYVKEESIRKAMLKRSKLLSALKEPPTSCLQAAQ